MSKKILFGSHSFKRVKTKKAYKKLRRMGFVMWEGDDSPESYKVLEKIQISCYKGGGRCIGLDSNGSKELRIDGLSKDKIKKMELSSGCFIAFFE